MSSTLEEERRALLEQIEASRAVYRRMLGGDNSNVRSSSSGSSRITGTSFSTASTRQASGRPNLAADFPRSHTMRWIIEHRWQLAIGATTAIILFGPGRKIANRSNVNKVRNKVYNKVRALPRTGVAQAVIGTGVSLLHNRNGLRMAGRAASFLLRWMQQRQAHSSS